MNLLMVTPYFFPRVGGVEKHVLRVSQELTAAGHQVHILTLQHDPTLAREEKIGEVSVWRLPKQKIWKARQLRWQLANQADIVHVHDAYSLMRFYLDYKILHPRKPFFITFHGYEGYPVPKEAIRIRKVAERLTRGNICIGDFISTWYGTRCDIVSYGGVDLPAETFPLPQEPAALYVGRLEKDTGILDYLEALRILQEKYGHSIPLDICGEGSLQEKLQSQAQEHNLVVHCHGPMPNISPILAQASMLFSSGYLTMLEGMAARRPVYALYDNPLKQEYLARFPNTENTLCFSATPNELAAAIADDLAHPQKITERIEAGWALAKQSSWKAVGEAYLQLYRTGKANL